MSNMVREIIDLTKVMCEIEDKLTKTERKLEDLNQKIDIILQALKIEKA